MESGVVPVKSNSGDVSACATVAFVERIVLGVEWGVLIVDVKSFVPAVRFCVEVQPGGNAGGATESKFCT